MNMNEQIFSLASLTVLELSPPEMVEVAAQAGYSHVGLRLEPATPEEHHFALVADVGLRRRTLARLRDTGIRVLDVEILRLKPDTVVADFEKILAVGAEFGARIFQPRSRTVEMKGVHQHRAVFTPCVFDNAHRLLKIARIGPRHEFQVRMNAVRCCQITEPSEVIGEPLFYI